MYVAQYYIGRIINSHDDRLIARKRRRTNSPKIIIQEGKFEFTSPTVSQKIEKHGVLSQEEDQASCMPEPLSHSPYGMHNNMHTLTCFSLLHLSDGSLG